MSLTNTNGGTLRKQSEMTVNVDGVLRNLKEITECKGGVLRKIFSKGGSGELPTSLTWDRDLSIDNYSNIYTTGTSEDGLTIKYRAKTAASGLPGNFSNFFTVPAGTVITFTPTSISGSGTTNDIMVACLYDADGKVAMVSTPTTTPITITVEEAGEYQIRLGGHSFTVTNTSTGPTYTYYDVTVTTSISFS